jgi:hypothetical protein
VEVVVEWSWASAGLVVGTGCGRPPATHPRRGCG